jgi:tellurite resistance protein TerC
VSNTVLLILFNAFIVLMLVIDLSVAQRKSHFPSMKEALAWTGLWILLATAFGAFIWFDRGSAKAYEYFSGYLVEEALSVDNVFIFIVIFNYFAVPHHVHHKVLFWGVLSAIVFRAIFIVLGAALVAQFHWILYLLGLFLVGTAIKLATQNEVSVDPGKNPLIRFTKKLFPVTEGYHGGKFVVSANGRRYITPLFLVLVMIETTDIAFATDSIPAIFALTRDTFIIYTSNIFAVLGLRALYFVVAGFMKQFRFLKYGLSLVLFFIGVKMLAEPWFVIPISASLIIIFSAIAAAVVLSLLMPEKSTEHEQ